MDPLEPAQPKKPYEPPAVASRPVQISAFFGPTDPAFGPFRPPRR